MSTPVLWILIPFAVGILLFFLRRWYRTTVLIGSLTVLFLAISAYFLPINELVKLGPLAFKIDESFDILGRTLFLGVQDRPLIILIYTLAGFWFSAAFEARAGRMFVPIGLTLVAVWMAALAVEPFLYAALLLELAVLLSIPLLSPPGSPPGRGIIRYLIFQTFGMPFILLTGWLLAGVESSPGNLDLVVQASLLLGFGFLFLLAIIPFHSWLPMVAEQAHPYPAGFIFFFLPLMVSLFGLKFIDQYAWLRQSVALYEALRLGGVLMIVIGGAWAALQRHMGRILGFAILTWIGAMLVAISVAPSLELFFAMQVPGSLSLALWALGLSMLQRKAIRPLPATGESEPLEQPQPAALSRVDSLLFHNLQGIGRQMPLAAAAVTLAALSFAGYPILAGFPVYQAIWRNLARQVPLLAALALFGSLSLGAGGLRSLAVLVMGSAESPWRINEHWLTASFLIVGILLTILLGLFPQWVLPYAATISQVFTQISSPPLSP